MGISNLDSLHTSVMEWASRPDLAARTFDFIRLAEDRLNSELVLREMQVELAMTAAPNSRNVVVFPSDYVEPYALFLTTFGDERELDPFVSSQHELSTAPATPAAWAIFGNAIELNCPCEQAHTFTFRYRKALRLLSTSEGGPEGGDTNWLLQNHPGIYLFASLVELATFNRDGDLATGYERRLVPLLDKLKTAESRHEALVPLRFDWPLSGGTAYDIRTG